MSGKHTRFLVGICVGIFACTLTLGLPGFTQAQEQLGTVDTDAFGTHPLALSKHATSQPIKINSATPQDYAHILRGEIGDAAALNAQLYLPPATTPHAAIIIVPGSGGVGPHHVQQAGIFADAGFAVLLLDPFSGRAIVETITDQGRLPFAASAYDVLSAVKYLRTRDDIDATRIGILGSSRGGTATLMAASQPLSAKVLGEDKGVAAVFAGYPWCGVQFQSGKLAKGTQLLILHGDKDNWVNPLQCQSLAQAARLTGSEAQMRLVRGAFHAFDREGVAPHEIPIFTALSLPTIYIDDDGTYINWQTGEADPHLKAQDFTDYSIEGGFAEKGVTVGSVGTQALEYRHAALAFFQRTLAAPPKNAPKSAQ